mgnify:CR=1 FL=1
MYSLQLFIKNSWLPELIIPPFLSTKILSALCIVDNLCAITKVVLFFVRFTMAFWTISSDSASKDEVASSNRIIDDSFNIALAIDILCFWPPDSLIPFSPIKVLYLSGNFSINSSAAANLHALIISSCEAFSLA